MLPGVVHVVDVGRLFVMVPVKLVRLLALVKAKRRGGLVASVMAGVVVGVEVEVESGDVGDLA